MTFKYVVLLGIETPFNVELCEKLINISFLNKFNHLSIPNRTHLPLQGFSYKIHLAIT